MAEGLVNINDAMDSKLEEQGWTYGNDSQNSGYAWAENMMTANSDLRIFVFYEPDCMVGVVSYLEKYAAEKGLDLADFCVVNCYVDSATQEELELAISDPHATAFKGYVPMATKVMLRHTATWRA